MYGFPLKEDSLQLLLMKDMNMSRTELEILAGEGEKFPRVLVDKCLRIFREGGLLNGVEVIEENLR